MTGTTSIGKTMKIGNMKISVLLTLTDLSNMAEEMKKVNDVLDTIKWYLESLEKVVNEHD